MKRAARDPVLILAPNGRDASVIFSMLSGAGIACRILGSVAATAAELDRSGTLVVAEEALSRGGSEPVTDWIASQPSWSDFPVILLTMRTGVGSKATAALLEQLGNVTILERPLHPVTLISAVRSGLRTRGRQKETESLFEEIQRGTERLRESERRFRLMADSAPVLIWMSDAEGALTFANRFYEEFFGRPATQMLGAGWRDTVDPQDLQGFLELMSLSQTERAPFRAEIRVYDGAGELRWLRCDAVPATTTAHSSVSSAAISTSPNRSWPPTCSSSGSANGPKR